MERREFIGSLAAAVAVGGIGKAGSAAESGKELPRRTLGKTGVEVTCLAIGLSLVPPPETASPILFELKMLGGTALLIGTGLLSFWYGSRKSARVQPPT